MPEDRPLKGHVKVLDPLSTAFLALETGGREGLRNFLRAQKSSLSGPKKASLPPRPETSGSQA